MPSLGTDSADLDVVGGDAVIERIGVAHVVGSRRPVDIGILPGGKSGHSLRPRVVTSVFRTVGIVGSRPADRAVFAGVVEVHGHPGLRAVPLGRIPVGRKHADYLPETVGFRKSRSADRSHRDAVRRNVHRLAVGFEHDALRIASAHDGQRLRDAPRIGRHLIVFGHVDRELLVQIHRQRTDDRSLHVGRTRRQPRHRDLFPQGAGRAGSRSVAGLDGDDAGRNDTLDQPGHQQTRGVFALDDIEHLGQAPEIILRSGLFGNRKFERIAHPDGIGGFEPHGDKVGLSRDRRFVVAARGHKKCARKSPGCISNKSFHRIAGFYFRFSISSRRRSTARQVSATCPKLS